MTEQENFEEDLKQLLVRHDRVLFARHALGYQLISSIKNDGTQWTDYKRIGQGEIEKLNDTRHS